MKKEKFMQQINFSRNVGGLTCPFSDYQLSEFIQHRRRDGGRLPVKIAVDHVGPQPNGSWVLGPSLFFSSQGMLQDPDESKYTWIGNLYEGPGIAHHSTACSIQLHVQQLVDQLRRSYSAMFASVQRCKLTATRKEKLLVMFHRFSIEEGYEMCTACDEALNLRAPEILW